MKENNRRGVLLSWNTNNGVKVIAAEYMKNIYTRFWFEFESENAFSLPPGIGIGCGVTAFDYNDAVRIIDSKIFKQTSRPPFKKIIQDVDIRLIDQNHVIPNMKPPNERGIWFPLGYD